MTNRGRWFISGCFLLYGLLLSGCIGADQPKTEPAVTVQPAQAQVEMKLQTGQGEPVQKAVPVALPAEPEDDSPAAPKTQPVEPKGIAPTVTKTAPVNPLKPTTESQRAASTPTPLPEIANSIPLEQWKEWPVLPSVSAEMRAVYQRGLAQGNNPNAFSVLGDCQSQPEVFMGVFDNDPAVLADLPKVLRETVEQFGGSFDRYSPTVKDGTTEGALLWVEWNDNKEKKCTYGETPLDCELRVHQPSIVFIHIGTHWEARNLRYLKVIIEQLLERGAVPVLVTKADNRELDERVNQNMALLAAEYNLPMWNFWASVQHLPENGMMRNSDMYLSKEGVEVHRMGALEALDTVWRAVREE